MVDVTTNLAPVIRVNSTGFSGNGLQYAHGWTTSGHGVELASIEFLNFDPLADSFNLGGSDGSSFYLRPFFVDLGNGTFGPSQTLFTINIKPGVTIDRNNPLDLTITVDDPAIGTGPDDQYSLQVTAIDPAPDAFRELLFGSYGPEPYQFWGSWLVTYSFDPVSPLLAQRDPSARALTEAEKDVARAAFQQWSDASGIALVEVPAGHGDIRPLITDNFDAYGAAFGPGTGYLNSKFNILIKSYGGLDLQLWLHEVGHSIGLDHPTFPYYEDPDTGEIIYYSTSRTAENDRYDFTVMAYNSNRSFSTDILGTLDYQASRYLYGVEDPENWDQATLTWTENGTENDDVISGVPGRFNYTGAPVSHVINGGGGDDTISVTGVANVISGGAGDDTINAAGTVYGDDGNDTLAGGGLQYGGAGNDSLTGGMMIGGAGDDLLRSGAALFSGAIGDYVVAGIQGFEDPGTSGAGKVVVQDLRAGSPDGTDRLISVNRLYFEGSGSNGGVGLPDQLPVRTYAVTEDQSISITSLTAGLRPWATSTPGGSLTVVQMRNPIVSAAYTINFDGTFTYTPRANFSGTDYILYALTNGISYTLGIMKVVVSPVNDAPTAPAEVQIALTGGTSGPVAIGASDVDRDVLTYSVDGTAPARGTVSFDQGSGTFTYTANPGATGTDSFAILISDGKSGTARQTVSVTLTEPGLTLTGGDKNDVLTGTERSDTLSGLAGSDKLDGLGGNDQLSGGEGNDHIEGGAGDDAIDGGPGNDKLTGGAGADTIIGGDGNDNIDGSAGDDQIVGGVGADTLTGGAGLDLFGILSVAESSAAKPDHITDLAANELIYLNQIDANSVLAGQQSFTWIGSSAFTTGTAGSLRAYADGKGGTIVQGELDGDGKADLLIYLDTTPVVTAGNFVLI